MTVPTVTAASGRHPSNRNSALCDKCTVKATPCVAKAVKGDPCGFSIPAFIGFACIFMVMLCKNTRTHIHTHAYFTAAVNWSTYIPSVHRMNPALASCTYLLQTPTSSQFQILKVETHQHLTVGWTARHIKGNLCTVGECAEARGWFQGRNKAAQIHCRALHCDDVAVPGDRILLTPSTR